VGADERTWVRYRLGQLGPYLEYLQVKDALAVTGAVVPAGAGDGQVRLTLAALDEAGFAGFVSPEPHLAVAGRFGGFSGPEDFARAASALKGLLAGLGVSWCQAPGLRRRVGGCG
jgi:sugar phosphate isomerase/epimerase